MQTLTPTPERDADLWKALVRYGDRYNNSSYTAIEHAALEALGVTVTFPTQIPAEVIEFMNVAQDAALELCGFRRTVAPPIITAAVMASGYSDETIVALDTFLKRFQN